MIRLMMKILTIEKEEIQINNKPLQVIITIHKEVCKLWQEAMDLIEKSKHHLIQTNILRGNMEKISLFKIKIIMLLFNPSLNLLHLVIDHILQLMLVNHKCRESCPHLEDSQITLPRF